jgi:uncharacterized membrane protein
MENTPIIITLYRIKESTEANIVEEKIHIIGRKIPLKLIVINDDQIPNSISKTKLPFIQVGPYHLDYPFTDNDLEILLNSARDRINHLDKLDPELYKKQVQKSTRITFWDKVSLWMSRHYLLVINLIIFLYTAIPFTAPVLMKSGAVKTAKAIYTFYSPLCHQLIFRSYFLFGEQAVYPRELAGLNYPITYERIVGHTEVDIIEGRNILGNEYLGYKVAICERDVAMYGSFLLFGLVFQFTKRKIKPLNLWIWLVLGIIPIAVDGLSQLGGVGIAFLSWLPMRESTPLLRSITGFLFGFLSGWYLFPILEQTISETKLILEKKFMLADLMHEK